MQSILTAEDQEAFSRDGFLVLRQLATPEEVAELSDLALDHYDQAIEPVEYETDVEIFGTSPEGIPEDTPSRLLQAYDRDMLFSNWATDPRIVNVVQQLLGSELVYLSRAHHNAIMTKHPQYSQAIGWHADLRYWQFENPNLINAWLALGDESPANGCMQLIPGSHKLELADEQLDKNQFLRLDLPENQDLIAQGEDIPLAPGDVLLYHAGLIHASGHNSTDILKLALINTYYGEDNGPRPATHSSRINPILVTNP